MLPHTESKNPWSISNLSNYKGLVIGKRMLNTLRDTRCGLSTVLIGLMPWAGSVILTLWLAQKWFNDMSLPVV